MPQIHPKDTMNFELVGAHVAVLWRAVEELVASTSPVAGTTYPLELSYSYPSSVLSVVVGLYFSVCVSSEIPLS